MERNSPGNQGSQALETSSHLDQMQAFIQSHTRLMPIAGLELGDADAPQPMQLWLADEITPIWSATEADLGRHAVDPPFWAFAWAGGQAVARLVLDRPEIVRGKRVLDIACGSGMIAIAAARSGAAQVLANDIDPHCEAALHLNAAANDAVVGWLAGDLLGAPVPDVDVILAGDIFYQKQMAERFLEWLGQAAKRGTQVFAGDPGRAYAPAKGTPLAEYEIETSLDLEGVARRTARVWQL